MKVFFELVPVLFRVLGEVFGSSTFESESLIYLFIKARTEVVVLTERDNRPEIVDLSSGIDERVFHRDPSFTVAVLASTTFVVGTGVYLLAYGGRNCSHVILFR